MLTNMTVISPDNKLLLEANALKYENNWLFYAMLKPTSRAHKATSDSSIVTTANTSTVDTAQGDVANSLVATVESSAAESKKDEKGLMDEICDSGYA
jgi:hypothetical protein